ncbi:hypothetical protein IQ235_04515 [Oscillatoriales cyanobacterium LEGE 11467]|uniref:Uncharacterized protein n=1 Tax=Zarconia navalis LEGE 11467 TaxID=1828826 RepID=A0A928VTG6_9CYAN|nr:hypothetical protein [Zarconia navalis]MBE9040054.1 hypothetical protein [Zarconia navalis LEGE 11467]
MPWSGFGKKFKDFVSYSSRPWRLKPLAAISHRPQVIQRAQWSVLLESKLKLSEAIDRLDPTPSWTLGDGVGSR